MPSERTQVSLKIVDTSLRCLGSKHRGALAPYIAEVDFSTVIVGNSPSMSFHLAVSDLSLFLLDDIAAVFEHPQGSSSDIASADAFWKVSPMLSENPRILELMNDVERWLCSSRQSQWFGHEVQARWRCLPCRYRSELISSANRFRD